MEQNNSLIVPGANGLAAARGNFRSQLEQAAEVSIQQYGDDFTPLERRSIVKVEQLRLLGGFELVALLERGAVLREIEQEGLVAVFPGDYQSLEDICQAIGISRSVYSDTRALCDVVFPWLEDNTDRPLQGWWEDIGISKFRELLPILRGLIEGESARNHESVNEAIRHQLDSAMAGILAQAAIEAGDSLSEEEAEEIRQRLTENGTLQRHAVANVLELGHLPVREMRQHVRPSRTPNIHSTVIRGNGRYYAVLRMDNDQHEMYQRLMGTHVDAAYVSEEDYQEQVRFLGRIVPE